MLESYCQRFREALNIDIGGALSLVFYQNANKRLHFSRIKVTLSAKRNWFMGSLIVEDVECKSFILVQGTQLELRNFGHPRSNKSENLS